MDDIDQRLVLAIVVGSSQLVDVLEYLPMELHPFVHAIAQRCAGLSAVLTELATGVGPDPAVAGPDIMGHYFAIKAELTRGGASGN